LSGIVLNFSLKFGNTPLDTNCPSKLSDDKSASFKLSNLNGGTAKNIERS
jgi:hypothetical protein